jgi:hypothetical protein
VSVVCVFLLFDFRVVLFFYSWDWNWSDCWLGCSL